jgi:hypothetical protein
MYIMTRTVAITDTIIAIIRLNQEIPEDDVLSFVVSPESPSFCPPS